MHFDSDTLSALILAGGRATRMEGRDKGLEPLAGRPMIQYVIECLQRQLKLIRINANRSQAAYAQLGFEVLEDRLGDYQGPLAGMARGLEGCPSEWLLVVPCDTPRLPEDLAQRLFQAADRQQAPIVVAHDGDRLQPVVSLLHRDLHGDLLAFLDSGERKIDRWYRRHPMVTVDFSDCADSFMNINGTADKQKLETRAPALKTG